MAVRKLLGHQTPRMTQRVRTSIVMTQTPKVVPVETGGIVGS